MGERDSGVPSGVKGLAFFAAATAPSLEEDGIMTPAVLSSEVVEAIDFTPFATGSRVKVLFKGDGMSLVLAWFGAGFRLPRHSHSASCLYYVVSGSLLMGARTVTAGDGFFVRAEQPYTYTAGPEGVEVLEFRSATSFDMTILDQTALAWAPLADIAIANHDRWLAPRHS
jgi:hypothetical protein